MATKRAPEPSPDEVLTELKAAWSRFPGWPLGRVLLHSFHLSRLHVADNATLLEGLREAAPVVLPPLNSAGTDEELDPIKRRGKR